jgi:hypothetical protein
MRLLFTLLSILLLVGCTITKRHFGPGYHVEWKKSYSKTENEEEKEKVMAFREDNPIETKSSIAPQSDSISSNTAKEEIIAGEPVCDVISMETIETAAQQIEKKSFPEKDEPVDDEVKQKTEPLTWVSLILLFVAGSALGIIGWYGSILFVGTGILITCLMIAMFICSLVSLIRIHRDPNRYKNKGLTHFLFSVSIICLISAAIYLIGISALASMSPMLQGI